MANDTEALTRSQNNIGLRHQKILELLSSKGTMSVTDLAEYFSCSRATIRRDLQALEEQGLGIRLHGAVSLATTRPPASSSRAMHTIAHEDLKEAIAQLVVSYIPDNVVVGLNGGTTTTMVARLMVKVKKPVTVVTNAVNIAYELSHSEIPVVVVGGAVQPPNFESTGPLALKALEDLHLDWAILGTEGIHSQFGMSTSTEQESAVGRAFAASADKTLVAADSSKLGRMALFRMLNWTETDYLVIDVGGRERLLNWSPARLFEVERNDRAGVWKAGGPVE